MFACMYGYILAYVNCECVFHIVKLNKKFHLSFNVHNINFTLHFVLI